MIKIDPETIGIVKVEFLLPTNVSLSVCFIMSSPSLHIKLIAASPTNNPVQNAAIVNLRNKTTTSV